MSGAAGKARRLPFSKEGRSRAGGVARKGRIDVDGVMVRWTMTDKGYVVCAELLWESAPDHRAAPRAQTKLVASRSVASVDDLEQASIECAAVVLWMRAALDHLVPPVIEEVVRSAAAPAGGAS